MPRFRWKGRSSAGHEVQGESSAASENEVVTQLRGHGIVVTTVAEAGEAEPEPPDPRERARSKPQPLRGALIAAGFFLAAFGLGYFVPVILVECERPAGGKVGCTLTEKDLGLVTIREQGISGVTTVDVESRPLERLSDGPAPARLVLGNAAGATIRPPGWDHHGGPVRSYSSGRQTGESPPTVGATTDAMRREIAAFLADSTSARVSTWQGQRVPLWIAGVLAGIGLLALALTALSLFQGPTDLIDAAVGRLAAAADRRKGR